MLCSGLVAFAGCGNKSALERQCDDVAERLSGCANADGPFSCSSVVGAERDPDCETEAKALLDCLENTDDVCMLYDANSTVCSTEGDAWKDCSDS